MQPFSGWVKVICPGFESQVPGFPTGVQTFSLGFLSHVTCLDGCGHPCGRRLQMCMHYSLHRLGLESKASGMHSWKANLAEGDLGTETQSSPGGDGGRARAPMLCGTGNLCPKLN